MKKIIIAAIIAFGFIIIPRIGSAAGMGIGMNTWFVWWKPYFTLETEKNLSIGKKYTANPNFLYGPVLTFYLPKHFTLSAMFLYGEFYFKKNETIIIPPLFALPQKTNYLIKRYDSDSSVTYSFTRIFNMSLGFKYTHFMYNTRSTSGLPGIMMLENQKKTYDEYAPALGFGLTIPLVEKTLYLIMNASGIFDFVTLKMSGDTTTIFANFYFTFPIKPIAQHVYKIGMNSTLTLAYYVEKINTTFTLGIRYQMFKMLNTDKTIDLKLDRMYDHFYGITAAVIYRINFPDKKIVEKDADSIKIE